MTDAGHKGAQLKFSPPSETASHSLNALSIALFEESSPRSIRFPNRYAPQRLGLIAQFAPYLIEQKRGNILRGGLDSVKGRDFVEITMIDSLQHQVRGLLQISEVHNHPAFTKRFGSRRDMNPVIVPMQLLALSLVVPQAVSGGKVGYDFNLVHYAHLRSSKRELLIKNIKEYAEHSECFEENPKNH